MDAPKGRPLNAAQTRAVDGLEEALRRVANAGVWICGMDDNLLAYRKVDLVAATAWREARHDSEQGGIYEAQRDLRDVVRQIDDHGAYRESGGW